MKRITLIALALVSMILATACDSKVFYTEDKRVNEMGWNLNDKLSFDIDVTDTLRIYSFFIDLRVSNDFPKDRAFLFINTTFPDGGVAADTLGCPLAAPDGKWYGRRSGKYIDNRYPFRLNMIFPSTGHYHFEIAHGMRDTNIVGIKNVGLRIEYADKVK